MNTTENNPASPASAPVAPSVHSRLMEMSEITRRNVRWSGNEHEFGVISATDAAMLDDLLGDALSLLNAAPVAPVQAQGVPEGWKLVPIKATYEMLCDGERSIIDGQENRHGTSWAEESGMAYTAMLAAAPLPPAAAPAPTEVEDKRDAERYRFVRTADNLQISRQAARDPVAYDAAIDAAIQAQGGDAA